jgi:hypothetical protein
MVAWHPVVATEISALVAMLRMRRRSMKAFRAGGRSERSAMDHPAQRRRARIRMLFAGLPANAALSVR